MRSPVEIKGNGRVEKVVFEKNELTGEPGKQKARATGQKEEWPCGIFFRSVGYHGVPVLGVPFDERAGVIPNQEGRVTESGRVIPGVYAAGWIKRGPTGVIGTNKADSDETVRHIFEDISRLPAAPRRDTRLLLESLKGKGVRAVSFPDWKKIDAQAQAKQAKVLATLRGLTLQPSLLDAWGQDLKRLVEKIQRAEREIDTLIVESKYGRQVCFWGGLVDTQKTLPFGTVEQVAEEVQKRLDVFSPGGGYVANPIHNVQAGCPAENVLRVFRVAQEYGRRNG